MTEVPEMPCQELVEVITDYLEGTLSEADRARFEAHLAQCPPCTEYLKQFRAVIAAVGSLGENDLAEPARSELLEAFRGWAAKRA